MNHLYDSWLDDEGFGDVSGTEEFPPEPHPDELILEILNNQPPEDGDRVEP